MKFKELRLKIPIYYLSYIINDDSSALEENKIKEIDKFIESLPDNGRGHFSCGEDEYFSYSNDINRSGSIVVDCVYYYEMKEK